MKKLLQEERKRPIDGSMFPTLNNLFNKQAERIKLLNPFGGLTTGGMDTEWKNTQPLHDYFTQRYPRYKTGLDLESFNIKSVKGEASYQEKYLRILYEVKFVSRSNIPIDINKEFTRVASICERFYREKNYGMFKEHEKIQDAYEAGFFGNATRNSIQFDEKKDPEYLLYKQGGKVVCGKILAKIGTQECLH